MDPKKRVTLTACMLFIMIGFLISGISLSRDKEANDTNKTETETYDETIAVSSESSAKPATSPDKYVLKIIDGIVVVFKEPDMEHPIIVTDIYASSLRNFDRERLKTGVVAENDIALQCMLEDYSS